MSELGGRIPAWMNGLSVHTAQPAHAVFTSSASVGRSCQHEGNADPDTCHDGELWQHLGEAAGRRRRRMDLRGD